MKLLLPIDGSPLALDAVRHALRLLHAGLHAKLVLVNVQEPATLYEQVTLHDAEALQRLTEAAGQDMLAPALALVQHAGVPHEAEVLTGNPVALLLEACERHRCDGIVMGSHGKGLVQRAWLGSVSQAVLEHAPVPVTLVKARDDAA